MAEKKLEEAPRSFGVFLRTLNEGECEADLSREMNELLAKLRALAEEDNGSAKGSLVLTLNFEVDVKDQCEIGYFIKTKEPTPTRHKANVWLNKSGNVVFENPRQQKLPLREVPKGSTELRDPQAAEAE